VTDFSEKSRCFGNWALFNRLFVIYKVLVVIHKFLATDVVVVV